MTLNEFADRLQQDHFSHCYIALMEMDGQYDLEVEISEGTIAGIYRTDEQLPQARNLADQLDTILSQRGITVFATRDEWENHLQDTY